MENVICGFIELNGELVKISSVEDLKAFAARLGSAFTELTIQDYEHLCSKMQGEYKADDCGVLYSKDGRKVFLLLLLPMNISLGQELLLLQNMRSTGIAIGLVGNYTPIDILMRRTLQNS